MIKFVHHWSAFYRRINTAVTRTLVVYGLTVLFTAFLNIDGVLSWYDTNGDHGKNGMLTALKRINDETRIGPWLDRFECAAGTVFQDSYKNKNKCVDNSTIVQTPQEYSYVSDSQVASSDFDNPSPFVGALEPLYSEVVEAPPAAERLEDSIQKDNGKVGFKTVLLVGDSLAQEVALTLGKELKSYSGVNFTYVTKVASGLNNPNVLNWRTTLGALVKETNPDLIFIMMGVNDSRNHIRSGGKLLVLGTPEWAAAYGEKVESLLSVASEKNATVYWIGVPVVRDEGLQTCVALANEAAKSACGKQTACYFIDTSGVLCDENHKYSNYRKEVNGGNLRIREKDGIHFTIAGSSLISKHIMSYLQPSGEGYLLSLKGMRWDSAGM